MIMFNVTKRLYLTESMGSASYAHISATAEPTQA
jgi:hypothetical protein